MVLTSCSKPFTGRYAAWTGIRTVDKLRKNHVIPVDQHESFPGISLTVGINQFFICNAHIKPSRMKWLRRFGLPASVASRLHISFYGISCKKSFHRISNFGFDIFEHKKTPAFSASAHPCNPNITVLQCYHVTTCYINGTMYTGR